MGRLSSGSCALPPGPALLPGQTACPYPDYSHSLETYERRNEDPGLFCVPGLKDNSLGKSSEHPKLCMSEAAKWLVPVLDPLLPGLAGELGEVWSATNALTSLFPSPALPKPKLRGGTKVQNDCPCSHGLGSIMILSHCTPVTPTAGPLSSSGMSASSLCPRCLGRG